MDLAMHENIRLVYKCPSWAMEANDRGNVCRDELKKESS